MANKVRVWAFMRPEAVDRVEKLGKMFGLSRSRAIAFFCEMGMADFIDGVFPSAKSDEEVKLIWKKVEKEIQEVQEFAMAVEEYKKTKAVSEV